VARRRPGSPSLHCLPHDIAGGSFFQGAVI
jgi:hypothetical protein